MTVVDLYTIQIVRDNTIYPGGISVGMNLDDAANLMPEIEENLTLLLPEGFRARIRRWDHADEPTQEDDDE